MRILWFALKKSRWTPQLWKRWTAASAQRMKAVLLPPKSFEGSYPSGLIEVRKVRLLRARLVRNEGAEFSMSYAAASNGTSL